MALVASDLNHPDFAGAVNPDSRLAVQFYVKPIQNEFESQKQGRPIFADIDFIKIFVPGDALSVIDQPVRDDHKARFPLQWAHYQNKHGGDTKEIGTPLAQWPRLTPSQVEELRAMKFFTVDAIAGASDANLQKLGMVAGMSAYAFRDLAQRFLAIAQEDAVAQKAEDRVKELEAANAKLVEDTQKQLAEMQAQMRELMAASKGKPERKPKAKPDGNLGTL